MLFKDLKKSFMFRYEDQIWIKWTASSALMFAFKPGLEILGVDDGIWRTCEANGPRNFTRETEIVAVEMTFRDCTYPEIEERSL